MMKKKVLIIILIGILTLGITGCELGSKEKNYSLGEQVKTELIKFKLLEGKYSYALSSTLNETYGAPKEYDEKSDKDSLFLASKGHTLVALSFSVENLDRTDLELENSFIEAKYNGKKYSDNNQFAAVSKDNLNWEEHDDYETIVIDSGEKLYVRYYIDIDEDIKDLDSTVELIVTLPSTNDKDEKFNYTVTKQDRKDYKGEPLELEVALQNFKFDSVKKYFEDNSKDYETLKESQINELVMSNNGDHYIQLNDSKALKYQFSEMKPSGNNLIIWPGGTGASSFMYSVGVWSVEGDTLKIKDKVYIVKKITDKNYLLLNSSDNSAAGLMS